MTALLSATLNDRSVKTWTIKNVHPFFGVRLIQGVRLIWVPLKAGVYVKAVFTPLNIGTTEISRSRFKQYKNPMLITNQCFRVFCKFLGDF